MRALLNEHRTVHAPFTIADEHLEYWGEVYCATPQRVSFERFLATKTNLRRGLLIPQQDLRRQLNELERAANDLQTYVRGERASWSRAFCVIGNGRVIEKLRHRRWPRSRHRDFVPEAK